MSRSLQNFGGPLTMYSQISQKLTHTFFLNYATIKQKMA